MSKNLYAKGPKIRNSQETYSELYKVFYIYDKTSGPFRSDFLIYLFIVIEERFKFQYTSYSSTRTYMPKKESVSV